MAHMKHIQALILAAGKSQRFNTGNTKLVEKICGQKMILYPTRLLTGLGLPTTVAIGYQKERVRAAVTQYHGTDVTFVERDILGEDGLAILSAWDHINEDNLLIMNADTPLVTPEIITRLYTAHLESKAALSFVTALNSEQASESYGHVIKKDGTLQIVPPLLCTDSRNEQCEIDAGIYIVTRRFLAHNLEELKARNEANPFRIQELVKIASDQNAQITTIPAPFDDIREVNTLQELWSVEHIKRAELIRYWMQNGVRFAAAQSVHLDLNITIGQGTFIGYGVHLTGTTAIGKRATVHSFSIIDNSIVGEYTTINPHTIITNTSIGNHASVGPFAHISEKTHIGDYSEIGNFVEVKRTIIGTHSKAKHLSYLGDARIEDRVNIGAGTITCNYDGNSKHRTIIASDALVGSNSALIAPVTIQSGSIIAAGSVITDNVPAGALAIARSRQINKEDYAFKIRARNEETKKQNAKTSSLLHQENLNHNQESPNHININHGFLNQEDLNQEDLVNIIKKESTEEAI